jgi:hypothetical protein
MIRGKDVLLRFLAALDALGIRYAVGGSLASGVHGQPRTTHDFDILVELGGEDVRPLLDALSADFYADEASARDALKLRRAFNVIHKSTAQKIDLFVSSRSGLDLEQMETRVSARLEPGDPQFFVTSPELIILRKLDWYRRGGGVSERQLGDVAAVLRQQQGRLDEARLERLAAQHGLLDSLARARGASR